MERDEIIALIQSNYMDEALAAMQAIADDRSQNEILALTGRLSSLNREVRGGLILSDQADIRRNRIRHSILELLNIILPEGTNKKADKKRTILFLGASPKDMTALRLNEEIQKIKDSLAAANFRDLFVFEREPAAQMQTILKAIQRCTPEIVHFSGHGSGIEGIAIEDAIGESVLFPTSGLKALFEIEEVKKNVQCVILNACYSAEQAKVISTTDVYVIGANGAIGDEVSISFTVNFYTSLGEGRDYKTAFQFGKVSISPFTDDGIMPELWYDGKKIL